MLNLTEEQEEILRAPVDCNICINAAPGSGKTTTLLYRVQYMWKNYNINLKEIAIFTYNKFLAKDMITKLNNFGIKKEDLGWCDTIHAFCYRETKNISDLKPWIDKYNGKKYECQLKYIIFDEYQDADKNIADVIKILTVDKYLTIVGDERQQIYGYNGANSTLLLEAKDNFIKHTLSISFRCNQEICKLLSSFYPSYTPIKSKVEGIKPILYRLKTKSMNDSRIIEQIVAIVNKQINTKKTIAILSPVIEGDKTLLFINDIQSNLKKECGIKFNILRSNVELPDEQTDYIITSIHRAKGREYDIVIVLNMVDGPRLFDAPNAEDLSKLFVACSRARSELHLFECLYNHMVGSLRWISDNMDLLTLAAKPFNLREVKKRYAQTGVKKEFKCSEYVKTLDLDERNNLLNQYHDPTLVMSELTLDYFCSETTLCEKLIEWLLVIKYTQSLPEFKFNIYMTTEEWRNICKFGNIPYTLLEKIYSVYGYNIKPEINNREITIKCDNDIMKINEDHIVSNIISNEYYKHIKQAIQIKQSLTLELTNETISKLWWLVKFDSLTKLSLVKFEQPELTPDVIVKLLHYISNTTIFNQLTPLHYNTNINNKINLITIKDIIQFSSPNSIIKVKCSLSDNNSDDSWLQLIVDSNLLPDINSLYLYNPIKGKLWLCSKKININ